MKQFLPLNLKDVLIIIITVKMTTIVGILTFMSRIIFVPSLIEHEKCFITSGPGRKPVEHRANIKQREITKKNRVMVVKRCASPL